LLAANADAGVTAISLDGKPVELSRSVIRDFGKSLNGQVLLAGDADYDAARRIWNGMFVKQPALIARCTSNEDVSRAVGFARDHGLLTAVRGGGHSWPGKSVCDGGLMLDLSLMTTVRVDASRRLAMAPGGALLNGLDSTAFAHGLATTTGVVSHTGVGGFTLGGGFGRLNRKIGLAVDNLEAATIVTADGRVRRIGPKDESDLFWAIRGGGGNFGVVTEFDFRLHEFERKSLNGNIVWPLAQARDVLNFYAEWSAKIPDELYVGPSLFRDPKMGDVIAMDVMYYGGPAAGEKLLAPLRAVGKPVADGVVVQDYLAMQTAMDGALAHGIRSYAKNGMVKAWSPQLVEAMLGAYDPSVFLTNHVSGGAVKRVGELDTAFPHRNAEIMLVVVAAWQDPTQDQAMMGAARKVFAALEPMMGGYYDNIDFDRCHDTGNYGPAYARLSKIKGKFDSRNLFRLNSNVQPA
jgi:FAD/FMN-containing dehydrogenase